MPKLVEFIEISIKLCLMINNHIHNKIIKWILRLDNKLANEIRNLVIDRMNLRY